jgi:gamma-glutamyl hercynylcysteine S-oxide synthase
MTTLGFTLELSHKADTEIRTVNATSSGYSSNFQRGIAARRFDISDIESELVRMRGMLIAWIESLTESALHPPQISTINPPLWEACHVAWFAEWWCVRDAYNIEDRRPLGSTRADRDSIWANCDHFLNSNLISHAARWQLPQITRAVTTDYLQRSLDAVLARLHTAAATDDGLYRFRLAMFHEAMHLEALAWCAQTLAWARPPWVAEAIASYIGKTSYNYSSNSPESFGDCSINHGFQFDNEIGFTAQYFGATIENADLISNQQFAAFVESGEFTQRTGRKQPMYWRRDSNDAWQQRRFDQWIPLAPHEPVIHVNAFEAEAYAHWVDARLPNESELHQYFSSAAQSNANTNSWHGTVWEWTSSAFTPPHDFKPGLYREYSAPWFDGKHRVLKGGSFATLPVMHHPHYRNFFTPERSDVFAGFRVVPKP